MKRSLTVVGAAVIVVLGAVAASQAQSPQNPQPPGDHRGGRPELNCGPERGGNEQAPGVAPGRSQRSPQGAMRGRGPGGGRQGGIGRPGDPGGPGRMGGRGNPLCGLDLSEDQKTQIEAIHQKTRNEIEAILTPEQKEKLLARRGGR